MLACRLWLTLRIELGVFGERRRDELGDFRQVFVAVALGQFAARDARCDEFSRDFDAVSLEGFDEQGAGEGGGVGHFIDADDLRLVGGDLAGDADAAVALRANPGFQRLVLPSPF